ncbi:MAG: hypothetical protein HY255_12780 [Betaproteobacteria bacterium]|nr:hypothetical protein [Betaproteobacteria bacterium]
MLIAVSAVAAFQIAGMTLAAGEDAKQPIRHAKPKGLGFPDFGHMVTPTAYQTSYNEQPIFRLKTDFPTGEAPKTLPAFMVDTDFKKDPLTYLKAAQMYSFEGNLLDFGGGGKFDWDPFQNKIRQWYHIPWLHSTQAYPPNGGTEGFRGLIKEASVSPNQLSATQAGMYQVYAVTLVNEYAGYTLGRMWKDPDNPDPRATDRRYNGGFPPGTVFAKFLFTDAPASNGDDPTNPADHVDYLQNGVEWSVYITSNWNSPMFTVKKVRLLQMDLMMRDPRADRSKTNPQGTGWVFGTFAYNGAVANPKSKFLNLQPLGLMWGNDPSNKDNKVTPYPPQPISGIINTKLKEQKIFDLKTLPPQHLGWNSRLNGPADLNTSSCMSCHNVAEYPPMTPLVAPGMVPPGGPLPPLQGGSAQWMEWFKNIECATSFDPTAYSTDMSWQISISLQNFYSVKSQAMQGQWTSEYLGNKVPIGR